jgi:hypothetical protein
MPSHIDLVDMNWVRTAQDWARSMGSPKAEMDFHALKARIARIRSEEGLPESERSIAVLARDFDNKRQDQLAKAIESAGFAVWEVDYRHAYVSTTLEDSKSADRAPQSLSHWLTYMCGLVAATPNPSVTVVSAAFELAGPLQDLVSRDGGRAVLAFFQRLLNKRWFDTGLLDGRLPIDFVDLEKYSGELLGTNLRELVRQSAAARRGPSLPL